SCAPVENYLRHKPDTIVFVIGGGHWAKVLKSCAPVENYLLHKPDTIVFSVMATCFDKTNEDSEIILI
uniref:Uncharacterized protein n=1 Tax=Strigamia maritima TaxID=126957 RepID=T1JEX9_STRMM